MELVARKVLLRNTVDADAEINIQRAQWTDEHESLTENRLDKRDLRE